ncbi:unnamed protein product [Effrenium voratum]|nr:unnamed protein product [Effrenium voratum]
MGQCNSSSAISVSQDLSPRGAMLCRGSDGAKYVEHEDLQYMEPVQSFRSMDAEQSARAMSGGPPMKATQTRHMERLNRPSKGNLFWGYLPFPLPILGVPFQKQNGFGF